MPKQIINDNVIIDLNRLALLFIIGALCVIGYKPLGVVIIGIALSLTIIRIAIEITRWFIPSFLMKQGKNK